MQPGLAVGEQRACARSPSWNPFGPPRRTRAPRPRPGRWSRDRWPSESAQSAAPFRAPGDERAVLRARRSTARYWNIAWPHPEVCWSSRAWRARSESTVRLVRRRRDGAGQQGRPAPPARLPPAAARRRAYGARHAVRARRSGARSPPAGARQPGRRARRRGPPPPALRRPPGCGRDPHPARCRYASAASRRSPRAQRGRAGLGPDPGVRLPARQRPVLLECLGIAGRGRRPRRPAALRRFRRRRPRTGHGGGEGPPDHVPVRPSIAR